MTKETTHVGTCQAVILDLLGAFGTRIVLSESRPQAPIRNTQRIPESSLLGLLRAGAGGCEVVDPGWKIDHSRGSQQKVYQRCTIKLFLILTVVVF